jgi:hypothetical protein
MTRRLDSHIPITMAVEKKGSCFLPRNPFSTYLFTPKM